MWLIKVFGAIYFAAVCVAQETENARPLPMSTVPPTAFVLPVPSLQQRSSWLDVFPSEKVEFSCGVTGSSDWTFTWSRNQQEIQDSDPNVSLAADGSVLTITAATQAYIGKYTCKGHHKTKGVTTAASNSLSVTVYANKPQPTASQSPKYAKIYVGESVIFRCSVNVSSGWEYVFYHKGNEIQAPTGTYTINSLSHADSGQYHCKTKRGTAPFYSEESKPTTLHVSELPTPLVSLQSPWLDVFENETVELKCEVNGSDWMYTWYKNQVQIENDSGMFESEESYLNITLITQDDEGGYACKVHLDSRRVNSGFSSPVNVTVYEDTPKPTLSKNPTVYPMYVGETVNLTCNVDVSWGWEYVWYKDGKKLAETSKTISVQLDPSTGGKYSCSASRGEITSLEISEEILQDVFEIPVPSLRVMTQWLDVFPGESAKLSCGMGDSSDWIYTWNKDGQKVQADVVSFDSSRATLSISSASAAHAGQYNCMGDLKGRPVVSRWSSSLTLSVYDKTPEVTLMRDPDYTVMFPGESVSFTCHISVPSEWEYLWYKGSQSLSETGNKYTIPVETASQGSYKCQAKRGTSQVFSTDSSMAIDLKVEDNKPKPSITQQPQPDNDKVYTGESVSFECKVGLSSGWEYVWFKDKARLSTSSSSFNIHNAGLSSSGTYECMGTRNKTMYDTQHSDGQILYIYEIPVPSLNLMTPWPDVFPGESVALSCWMDGSSDWTYKWYKDGQEVQDGVSFGEDASSIFISPASTSHRGRYSCTGKLKSRFINSSSSSELMLDVYDSKPQITLMQNPGHSVMYTGDSVSFSCHIEVSSGWEYLWYKGNHQIDGSTNNHTISSALTKDTGSYKCKTKRKGDQDFYSDMSQSASLEIKERPKPDIILLTGWSEVFSTDSLVLLCGMQEGLDWNYTWFKADQPIDLPSSEKHIVTPQNDPEQSLYTCKGFRSGRPSYSQISDHFKTKNLLLKRRVLLSICGFIVFAIIAIFLGCIILRAIRKPAKDEYKPEEADLFLSMDQMKNCEDAPCPLVQYITDASLNTPSKEGDENGTICSETPLPITSQEEQAVITESQDATENNGGLVSFKQ